MRLRYLIQIAGKSRFKFVMILNFLSLRELQPIKEQKLFLHHFVQKIAKVIYVFDIVLRRELWKIKFIRSLPEQLEIYQQTENMDIQYAQSAILHLQILNLQEMALLENVTQILKWLSLAMLILKFYADSANMEPFVN